MEIKISLSSSDLERINSALGYEADYDDIHNLIINGLYALITRLEDVTNK